MKKMYKDGVTKYVNDRDVQEFKDWGFVEVPIKQHKPEPMEIKEDADKAESKKVK